MVEPPLDELVQALAPDIVDRAVALGLEDLGCRRRRSRRADRRPASRPTWRRARSRACRRSRRTRRVDESARTGRASPPDRPRTRRAPRRTGASSAADRPCPNGLASPSGKRRLRQQQQARRADAVGAQMIDGRSLAGARGRSRRYRRRRSPAPRVDLDLAHARAGDQPSAALDRVRPEGDVAVDFAPSGQPVMQVPRRTHGLRPLYGSDGMALVPGHQCQPSLSRPSAALRPTLPIGSGGVGKCALRRIGGVARQAGDADLALDLLEERAAVPRR